MDNLLNVDWPFAAVLISVVIATVIAYGIRKGD